MDACQGDSGGPLICVVNDRPVLYVIELFGYEYGRLRSLGVHVPVETFVDWILSQMNKN